MTTVVDASAAVAALVDSGERGEWARVRLTEAGSIVAPQVLPVEVTSALRAGVAANELTVEAASLALDDVPDLGIAYFSSLPLLARIWALRENVTAYDAWYVALAEALQAPLLTLDARLVSSPGPACEFRTPDSG